MKMKFYRLSIILIVALGFKCNTSSKMINSYSVIRNNYFSRAYNLPVRDTNKVNKDLYEGIFHKISFENEAKCLLMKVYAEGRVSEEYGLYDYMNSNYYFTSIANKNLFHFERLDTSKHVDMYRTLKKFVNQHELLQHQVDQPGTSLLDGASFEASLIQVDSIKKEIVVKSYHW
ncbi:MAG: hypothetical protein ACTHMC_09360 [Pseudobacter sp.]|uniref:hypothetical protein n=1 Tax=Pseudobacter sp. TaxID=2045420 RepID=UPI003F7F7C43